MLVYSLLVWFTVSPVLAVLVGKYLAGARLAAEAADLTLHTDVRAVPLDLDRRTAA